MALSIGQRALITGASRGIGQATAMAFAQAGFDLVLVSRSKDELEAVAAAARALGVDVQTCPLDLGNVDQVAEKMAAIATQFGPIHILVQQRWHGLHRRRASYSPS